MTSADLLAQLAPDAAALTPTDALILTDDELIRTQRRYAEARRALDAAASVIAAEIAYRSRRELGYEGLAQRRGARTPEALVQLVTGLSHTDARTLVRVGALVAEHDAAALTSSAPATPWLVAVAAATAAGRLSVEAAEAIRCGLGEPGESVSVEQLAAASERLVAEAATLTLERLTALARHLRDDLDEAGIASREQQRRERRYLTLTPLSDGMTRITGLLDPESAAIVVGAVDAITSPRRGGPRFVDLNSSDPSASDPSASAPNTSDPRSRNPRSVDPLLDDSRTLQQLAVDALVDLVRVATLADDGRVLGARRVGVRVHVAERDLQRGEGAAHFEGQTDAVSIATARRHACEAGIVPVLFDSDGQVINVGREQRLFTGRQRVGLAARDGGCRWVDCDRPPTWTEAHHINEWQRDGGLTDLQDGVLLCRHHHLLLHNNGWRIERERAEYWLVPPPGSAARERIPLPPKSRVAERVIA